MFVPDMFHFWLNEIITSFLYSLEGTGGGGLLQKINIIRFFLIVRCGNDCYKTVLVHNKTFWQYFTSASEKFNHELLYMFGYIYFTHDMLFIYFL